MDGNRVDQPTFAKSQDTGRVIEQQLEELWNDFYHDEPNDVSWTNLAYYVKRYYADIPVPPISEALYDEPEALRTFAGAFGPLTVRELPPGGHPRGSLPESLRRDAHKLRYHAKIGPDDHGSAVLGTNERSAIMLAVVQMLREIADADNNRPKASQH